MSDSSSFSSLLALVDSHLTKTNVEDGLKPNNTTRRFSIPTISSVASDSQMLQDPKLPLPSFNFSESSIKDVLAEQVANMLKAKEVKRQQEEEKKRLEDELKQLKIEESDCVIDLMQALQSLCSQVPLLHETLSSSSSFESLFERKFIDCDIELKKLVMPEPVVPYMMDMSYVLNKRKIAKSKCSAFGKVVSAKLKPVAAPYFREHIPNVIKRFDFLSKSPCDLIKEKLRKPTMNTSNNSCDNGTALSDVFGYGQKINLLVY